MRLVQAQKLDSVDDYRLIDAPVPAPASSQVLIQVHACGMGYVDALVALGRYQVKPPLPFTPGQEIGGVIEAVGEGVSQPKVGERVMASLFGGGLAEYVTVPAPAVQVIPDAMTYAQAAGFRVNYLTALHGLEDRAALQPGERLLVLGAAGGVGTAAIQIGRLLGAEVIAAASTPEKRAFALAQGAQRVLDTQPDGWRERLKQACEGGGPDVVFDPVCGPLFELAFRSQSWRGRHLVVGFVGGPIPKLPANLPLMKGASLVGVDVRQFLLFEAERGQSHLRRLLAWVAEGRLTPPVGRRFPLTEFAQAMQFATSGAGSGKTVIELA
ncbi:MAG TPA: NADPH:quinone oxidoreductase family protein [Myxococcota bacterium]|nr:NADPH:quinone oxidoreductase family protein [Myxococcota bacterium]